MGTTRSDDGHGPSSEAAFVCPGCGDEAVIATNCERCERMTVPRASAVLLTRPNEVVGERSRVLTALGISVALAFPTLVFLAIWALGAYVAQAGGTDIGPGSLILPTSLAFGSVLGLAELVFWLSGDRRRAWSQRRKDRQRRRAAAPTAARDLPAQSEGPVRVSGRVRVEAGALVIEDGDVRVRVDAGAELRGYDEDGRAVAVSDGDEVEVVGRGARRHGAGDGYRDTNGEFHFDAEAPLQLWVRRRG